MKMRTVKIGAMKFEKYLEIIKLLHRSIPFALEGNYYDDEYNIAYISFTDTDYVPDCMKVYIINRSPADDMRSINEDIIPLMEWKIGEKL